MFRVSVTLLGKKVRPYYSHTAPWLDAQPHHIYILSCTSYQVPSERSARRDSLSSRRRRRACDCEQRGPWEVLLRRTAMQAYGLLPLICFGSLELQLPGCERKHISHLQQRGSQKNMWQMAGMQNRGYCSMENLTTSLAVGSHALDEYLSLVYGPPSSIAEARRRSAEFSWDKVEFVWEKHLPSDLRERCVWPCDPNGFGSVFRVQGSAAVVPNGSLWVYRRHRFTSGSHLHSSREAQKADKQLSPYFQLSRSKKFAQLPSIYGTVHVVEDGGLREISHTIRASEEVGYRHSHLRCRVQNECYSPEVYQGFKWMYSAVGSGIFYPMGRTILSSKLNYIMLSLCQKTGLSTSNGDCGGYPKAKENRSFTLNLAKSLDFDTVVITDKVEWSSPGFKVEVVGIRRDAAYSENDIERVPLPVQMPNAGGARQARSHSFDSRGLAVSRVTRCPLGYDHLTWGWDGLKVPCICKTGITHIECLHTPTVT